MSQVTGRDDAGTRVAAPFYPSREKSILPQKDKRRQSDLDELAKSPIRILAIDDDRSYLTLLRLILTRAGFEVTIADDGRAGIEQFERDPDINLILIDLAMPAIDGIETLHSIQERAAERTLYTILLTAHSGSETKLRAYASGFDDFVAKGEPEAEFVARVRSAARRLELERQLHLDNQRLEALAFTDELTGIGNRRALFRAVDEFNVADQPFGVILLDLDRFKDVNDLHGHATGDRVLVDVAGCLKAKTRVGDVIGRYGGDEFVVLLPGAAEREVQRIGLRIAQAVAALEWKTDRDTIRVRASFGIATGSPALLDALQQCDVQLYRNKPAARGNGTSNGSGVPPPSPHAPRLEPN